MKNVFKLLFSFSIITILTCGCTQNFSLKNDTQCYNSRTSLEEKTKACIELTVNSFGEKFDNAKNIEHKEIVSEKITFAHDYVQLSNHLVQSSVESYIPELKKNIIVIPVLVDKSWLEKGLSMGTVLRPDPSDGRLSDDVRYYLIGYLENANKEGLYTFNSEDIDIDDSMAFYGSCGRRCSYFPFEVVEYKAILGNGLDNDYKKEKFPNIEETLSNCANLFSKESCSLAVDYAKKLKYVFRHKDYENFADIISYPFTIYQENKEPITINLKRELLNFDKKIIMNDKIFNAIDQNSIFVNWKGFMLGCGEVWWYQDGNNVSDFRMNVP